MTDPMHSTSLIFTPDEAATSWIRYAEFIRTEPGLTWGVERIDRTILPLRRGQILGIIARPGHGKAQPMHALVKTIDGWKEMGNIEIGDKLASVDGEDSYVVSIHPQGMQQTYRLTFADGRTAESTGEHLWNVYSKHWKEYRVITTLDIIEMLSKQRNRGRIYTQLHSGNFGINSNLPIHPYVLGVLIGDGALTRGACFTSADNEIIERVNQHLVEGYVVGDVVGKYGHAIIRDSGKWECGTQGVVKNYYKESLRELGLLGHLSVDKFIPSAYLNALRNERFELLRGLLDTDGTVHRTDKTIYYSTSSKRLASDFQELVRSLGGICNLGKTKHPFYRKLGIKQPGQPSYNLTVRHPEPDKLFALPRKASLAIGNQYADRLRLGIVSVEKLGHQECQCIRVSHPSGLYLTNDYTVTHNSSLAVYLARREAQSIVLNGRKEMVFYVTLDQPVEEIETVMQSESGISVSDISWGRADLEVMRAKAIKRVHLPLAYVGKSAIEYRRTAPFTFRNIYTEITNEARRLGVRVSLIVIDYIQKFHVGEREQRNDQVTEAIFAARELALDLQCKMIVCVQAAREVDRDGDKLPRAHHCQHASAIEQEADALVGLWRPIKTETAREVTVNIGGQKYLLPITPELLLMRLDKQRGEAAGINYALHFSPQLVSLAELEL